MSRVCLLTGGASLADCYQNLTTHAQILSVLQAQAHGHGLLHKHKGRVLRNEDTGLKKKQRDHFRLLIF